MRRTKPAKPLRCFLFSFTIARSDSVAASFHRIHDIRPQCIFCSAYNIVTGVDEVAMLKEQDAPSLWFNVYTLDQIAAEESRGTAL